VAELNNDDDAVEIADLDLDGIAIDDSIQVMITTVWPSPT
jgi:hypothetical protein